jgi:hypothetical protein
MTPDTPRAARGGAAGIIKVGKRPFDTRTTPKFQRLYGSPRRGGGNRRTAMQLKAARAWLASPLWGGWT